MTMELSMTIALVAALAIGEFFTALVIVFFVLIAEALESLTVGRGRRAIKDLLDLLPNRVVVRRDGLTVEVERQRFIPATSLLSSREAGCRSMAWSSRATRSWTRPPSPGSPCLWKRCRVPPSSPAP